MMLALQIVSFPFYRLSVFRFTDCFVFNPVTIESAVAKAGKVQQFSLKISYLQFIE